jgi:hypothetical protein
MKTLNFTVTLQFDEDVNSDEEIIEVANNISDAIQFHYENVGIAPIESDNFVVDGTIKPQFLNDKLTIKF